MDFGSFAHRRRPLSRRFSAVHFRRVIAWDLGGIANDAPPKQLFDRAELLRRLDPVMQVPVLTDATIDPGVASRAAEILVHYRPTLGTEFTFGEYADWISRRIDRSHPGTVHWIGLDTQPPAPATSTTGGFWTNRFGSLRSRPVATPNTVGFAAGSPRHLFSVARTIEPQRSRPK